MSLTVMLKIVHAALKTKAKAWTFEAKAIIIFDIHAPKVKAWPRGLRHWASAKKKSEEKERAVDSSEQNASRSLRPINHVLERNQCLMKMQSVGDAITMRH